MIKDSKLIGTKIKAPFGWKKFKVGKLFDMHSPSGNGLYSSADGIKFDKDDFVRCTTSSRDCNGVPICLPRSSFGEILGRGLSVASNGDAGSVFYHNDEFAVLQDSYALTLKSDSDKISDFTYLFLCAVLNKQFELFSYTTKAVWKRYNMLEIELPVTTDNQPDFEWMSAYVKAVKVNYLEQKALSNRNEIEAYLSAGNTDSMNVTDDDRQFLRDFEKLPRRKFKVGELFDVINRGNIFNKSNLMFVDSKSDNAIHFVVQSDNNNGDSGFVKDSVDFKHFCDSIVIGRQTGYVYYEPGEFVTTDGFLVLSFTTRVSERYCLYLVSIFRRLLLNFEYTNTVSASKLTILDFYLPVIDSSQIDTKSIEKYMQIQSKPLINNVVKALVPVGGGATLIDFAAIERYMQIQIKLTIGKHAKYLDKELALMKIV